MPKEQIRKRGKRKPKAEDVAFAAPPPPETDTAASIDEGREEGVAGPSGLHPARAALLKGGYVPRPAAASHQPSNGEYGNGGAENWTQESAVDPEYPFGVLDPDIKAYFRNVEDQIRDWEGTVAGASEEREAELREDRNLFLQSVLSELRGHELPASTDPDTSLVLERLLPSMGDRGRRVIGDSFAGNWEGLLRHRFGSHVVQTWFTLAAETLDREARGVWPSTPTSSIGDAGELPKMTSLFAGLLTSLRNPLPMLLTHAHASPPVRLLLLVISPNRTLPSLQSAGGDLVRSKKSNKFRKGHGVQGKSFIDDSQVLMPDAKGKGNAEATTDRRVPAQIAALRRTLRESLMEKVSEVEWKSMGMSPVGSAAVQLLLDLESDDAASLAPGSLLDVLTEGQVSSLASDSSTVLDAKPYLTSLLASIVGSRLFEAILTHSPDSLFAAIWKTYFEGKVGKLASHPYANFVVARAVSRLDEDGVRGVIQECGLVSGGKAMIKSARTSVLQALVERATGVDAMQMEVIDLICSALDLPPDQRSSLVPCLMTLKTYPIYNSLLTGNAPPADTDDISAEERDLDAEEQAAAAARHSAWENRRTAKAKEGGLAPNMQGCLLLQESVGLGGGANEVVLESLIAQPTDLIVSYARHAIASHFLDVVLEHPSVPLKYRRKLMLLLLPRSKELAEDKFGSRITEKLWERGDGYLKERMAASLVPHATSLFDNQYGKYLARRLNLQLYARRPEEWKETMLGVKHHFAHQKEAQLPVPAPMVASVASAPKAAGGDEQAVVVQSEGKQVKEKKKRRKEKDAIDDLFAEKKGKRVKA